MSALPSTEVKTAAGDSVSVVTIGHASLLFTYQGHPVYVDPWSKMADYTTLPKADVILITHAHGDHLDASAVAAIRTPSTVVISTAEVAATLEGVKVLANGDKADPAPYIKVLAVPAYNLPSNEHFHPKGRDNGYIITFGGTTFFVAGDAEPNPDLLAIKADVIFLPVNQPYTMTVQQAVQAAKAIQPKIFYPYHYAETEIEQVKTILAKEAPSIDVRLPPQKRLGE
jgi:L-ascorbate metabolism protein UlaG (beta-lactamase superfamily)